MARSMFYSRGLAFAAGLVSAATLAGTANAQMHDLVRHSARGAGGFGHTGTR